MILQAPHRNARDNDLGPSVIQKYPLKFGTNSSFEVVRLKLTKEGTNVVRILLHWYAGSWFHHQLGSCGCCCS